jgi:hypothetical protein
MVKEQPTPLSNFHEHLTRKAQATATSKLSHEMGTPLAWADPGATRVYARDLGSQFEIKYVASARLRELVPWRPVSVSLRLRAGRRRRGRDEAVAAARVGGAGVAAPGGDTEVPRGDSSRAWAVWWARVGAWAG